MAKNKNYKYVDKIKTSYGWRYIYDTGNRQYIMKDVETGNVISKTGRSTGNLISKAGKSIANNSRNAYNIGDAKASSPASQLAALGKRKQDVESIGHLISRTGKSIANESKIAYDNGVRKVNSPEARLAAFRNNKQEKRNYEYDPTVSSQSREAKTKVEKVLKLKLSDLGENIKGSIVMSPAQRKELRNKIREVDWEERQKKEDEDRRKNEQFLESIGVKKNKNPWRK